MNLRRLENHSQRITSGYTLEIKKLKDEEPVEVIDLSWAKGHTFRSVIIVIASLLPSNKATKLLE